MECRNLSETKSIKIDDAEFTIGFIPRKAWRRLAPRLSSAMRAISKHPKDTPYETLASDPDWVAANEQLEDVYYEMARYGVRSHSNLVDRQGKAIECKKLPDGTVSEETVDLYDLNKVLAKLGTEVLTFNTMTEQDQKN